MEARTVPRRPRGGARLSIQLMWNLDEGSRLQGVSKCTFVKGLLELGGQLRWHEGTLMVKCPVALPEFAVRESTLVFISH